MAYAKAAQSGPSSEIARLQGEITDEVNADATHLAESVFGKPGNMPDIARVPDYVMDNKYRSAYQSGDRQWLISEAQRDPEQFVKVARRIGVVLPEEMGQQQPLPKLPSVPAPPLAAPAPPPQPPGGVPAPAPIAPPSVQVPQPMPAPAPPMPPMGAPPVM